MRPSDATLAALPESFRYARSTARTVVFAVLAGVALVALVLVLVNFGAIRDDASEMTGRRSGLRGVVAPTLVVVAAFFALLFAWFAIGGAHRWIRVDTGTALSGRHFLAAGGRAEAEALHARFATGDPAVYLPVPNHKKGDIRLSIYLAVPDRTAYVTVRLGKEPGATGLPLITLHDRAYVQLKRLGTGDLVRPSASGVVDPFLRG
ncbi:MULTISPECIES: hypothetical protein [Agromyces]|uniref:hypothetical protein n=1 Tax=Agromyces TaxID=33877 RepID=UPI001E3D3E73|nr:MULTISPECIES: hypothetical protein [Agromyces]MCD1570937.1 hypothetical protein [Agromyces mediolanus]GLU89083.1 hypothetical protein Agsp01_13380 [Agromyces sp. NBRC 114283]